MDHRTILRPLTGGLVDTSPCINGGGVIPDPETVVSSAAITNKGNYMLHSERPAPPCLGCNCGQAALVNAPPPDDPITLEGFTIDCNGADIFRAHDGDVVPQMAGSDNAGCLSFANLEALTMSDVSVVHATVDGMDLGLTGGGLGSHANRI